MIFDPSTIAQIFQSIPIAKDIILVLIGLYIIFAFVILNQVRVMNKVIDTPPVSFILAVIAFLHLLASASLFLLALAIL